jgi:cell division protein FtsI (penicillin-binding protein 3)/stage V sporulation protein D (sporulation-specific penicillin-binding protein)
MAAAWRARSKAARGKRQKEGFDRVQLLLIAFAVITVLVLFKLFRVQVIQHTAYKALASGQHELVEILQPERGEVFAQDPHGDNGVTVIATNQDVYTVFVNPRQIQDPQLIAERIAPILALDRETIEELISQQDRTYVQLKQRASQQQVNALQQLIDKDELFGVDWLPEDGRLYPHKEIAAAVTGFIGFVEDERKGQYGIEAGLEEQLSGSPGKFEYDKDASGQYTISVGKHDIIEAQDGEDIYTTIDINIQNESCRALEEAVDKWDAKRGSVLVMNPKTGAILSMCNVPHYDPNAYGEVEDYDVLNNHSLMPYESGSVFKTFAMAAAINEGNITPYTTYEDTGEIKVDEFTIKNSDEKANGVVDMNTALELSLNTGSIFAVSTLTNELWKQYVKDFGFGEASGVSLSNESAGNIAPLDAGLDINSWTSSYGQGITVTPLQMISAYAAIANDGMLMKPHIIERIIQSDGTQKVTEPEVIGQPIRPETARTVSAMLVNVVDGGHAIEAGVEGYFVAGKTGTAEIPREDGAGYYQDLHNDTFVGFFPVSDPQVVMLVKIDEPTAPWAAISAAPVFGKLSQYLVNYMHIPPDRVVE